MDLIRRHNLHKDNEDVKLELLPHTSSGAVNYALSQPDVAFRTNDGAFESPSEVMKDQSHDIGPDVPTNSEQISGSSASDPYLISGAL